MGSHVDYLRGHQRAKKVVSHSLGLVDFAIGLANSVLNLPDWQVKYFEEFNLQKICEINFTHQKILGLVETTFGLQSQSKWLGHFGVSLSPQCWCTRFGDQTAINNFERDEGSTRREKTAFG